ncbi:MAG: sigma 54-interacting transcriptional regulator [Halieaceae bacterium]|jgi:two-component system nitrogen regulation response regulator GlnG|nr:sigma 54-interacting transcriptional regulator [Halieaceae bacterium]
MSTNADADLTVPSVAPPLRVDDDEQGLLLTIIFHPDISRIGHTARLPDLRDSAPWVLGRRSPDFCPAGDHPASPLGERDVSRQALALARRGEALVIRRLPGSSRCRIDGSELEDEQALDRERLRRGVALLLGHSVVLLLRLAPLEESTAAPEIAQLCGGSRYMHALRQQIDRIGRSGLDVLVRGETGTGKELVAEAIHRFSGRSSGPLVKVNMAAIPPGLAAATLFGSARGAFTGATRASEGYFGQAHGGTLFLDEIGDTPAEIQPQLLRALQEREIQAVGGALSRVDVRVISATDAPVEGEGCDFKAALRHRLGACEITLLPLRGHPEDIGELLRHFLAARSRALDCPDLLPGPASPALEIASWAELFYSCLRYDWPGNVRELANCASQVVVAGGRALPDAIRLALRRDPVDAGGEKPVDTRRRLREVDEEQFAGALRDSAYEVADVARQLGVSRQAVYRRMADSPRHRLAGQVPLAELEQALTRHGGNAHAAALELKVSPSGLRARLRDSGLAWF